MAWEFLKNEDNSNWDAQVFTVDRTPQPGAPHGIDALGKPIVQGQPYTLAVSAPYSNNNDKTSVETTFCLHNITPNQQTSGIQPMFGLTFVVENETTPGSWAVLAQSSGQPLNNMAPNNRTADLICDARANHDTGQPFDTITGFQWFSNKGPSETVRARVIAVDDYPFGTAGELQQVVLTGSRRLS